MFIANTVVEHIAFEVDSALAKAWNNSSPSVKAVYENKIMAVINEPQTLETDDDGGFNPEQLAFLKAEAAENENIPRYEWWNDEEMVAELEQIADDLESGKDPGVSWEEVKKQIDSGTCFSEK